MKKDTIAIDIPAYTIQLKVSDDILAAPQQIPATTHAGKKRLASRYARLVSSADQGLLKG
ncbi:MAG: hypothetical protein ACLVKS_04370 [Peptococcus niger]